MGPVLDYYSTCMYVCAVFPVLVGYMAICTVSTCISTACMTVGKYNQSNICSLSYCILVFRGYHTTEYNTM